jgi:hypothetical protein
MRWCKEESEAVPCVEFIRKSKSRKEEGKKRKEKRKKKRL